MKSWCKMLRVLLHITRIIKDLMIEYLNITSCELGNDKAAIYFPLSCVPKCVSRLQEHLFVNLSI